MTTKSLSSTDTLLFLVCSLVGLDTLGSVAAKGAQGFLWLAFLSATFFVPYALLTAELGSAFPENGGVYVWSKLAFGRAVAGISTLFYWISNPIWLGGALTITAIASFETFFFPLGPVQKVVFGLALVWLATLGAIVSLRAGRWVAVIGAVARAMLLVGFTVTVILYAIVHGVHGVSLGAFAPTWDGFTGVVPLLFFNFVGFELPSAASRDIVDPKRSIPSAVLRSAALAVLAYGVPILAIIVVLPSERITGLKGFLDAIQTVFTVYGSEVRPGEDIVRLAGAGRLLGCAAAIGFIVAIVTSGTTWIIGADRSQAAACADGAGPRWMAVTSARFGTPLGVNLASGVVATIVMLAAFWVAGGSAEKLFSASLNLGISTTTMSYLAVFPALYVLRKKQPGVERPFRVRAALATSIVTTFWAAFASANLVWPGFVARGDADAALPPSFVTLDAVGRVVASERMLFELTQLVPLAAVVLTGVLFVAARSSVKSDVRSVAHGKLARTRV